uniref:DNA topoisomerase n=1 Tax=Eubacterium cellulosolvens TaxID=29322 RepID=UPI0004848AEE|nr:DNA topoisomerase [[Eubacterium] cellulosolvens]
MSKSLYIAEKPSVAQEFAKALHENFARQDGYLESEQSVVTWCVGHLVTMSYPDKYDEKFKRWSFDTLPFLPETFKYEIIPPVKKQFKIVSGLLNREDVETIYVCTDSGREGEYIYRLVAMMAKVPDSKKQKRVWIDSQTEEEITRGIREAKDISEYDHLSDAAFLRAKEDYLMGINFSRALSLRYARDVSSYLGDDYHAVSVGRVMTCVLGMVVKREREIRDFEKTPFYRVLAQMDWQGHGFDAEWRAVEGSRYFQSPKLYKENGFRKKEDAQELVRFLQDLNPQEAEAVKVEKKTTKKNPPLLYNLAEIQNDCSRYFKISPDAALNIIQELYEKKLVTYPRTDARVLSTAIAKGINRNITGLKNYGPTAAFAEEILEKGSWKNIAKTKYTNDKQITDHYAIIPTGQGLQNLKNASPLVQRVYDLIVRRFLSIFYPPAVYQKIGLEAKMDTEHFFANFSVLTDEGYLKVAYKGKAASANATGKEAEGRTAKAGDNAGEETGADGGDKESEENVDENFLESLKLLKKGSRLPVHGYEIKEGETSPPKRYTSGSMILAMENAGQLIEDDELREQIRGSGIGTSATRAEILKKLFNIKYLDLNKKTQVITPTQLGEMVHDVVFVSIRPLLNPELTASWEKGLTYVSEGQISSGDYLKKLEDFVARRTNGVKAANNQSILRGRYDYIAQYYKKTTRSKSRKKTSAPQTPKA